MVDLGYDERSLNLEQVCTAAQNFVLAAFDVDLDQLRGGSSGNEVVIQCNCWHRYDFAGSYHRTLAVDLYSTL